MHLVLRTCAFFKFLIAAELDERWRELIRVSCCYAFQVLVEVALSLVLCLWAALKVPGSFLPILPDAKENR